MTTKTILELIAACEAGNCSITLEACTTGVVARIASTRGDVALETSVYLDAQDPELGAKLNKAIRRTWELSE